jgi:hypothetical protein
VHFKIKRKTALKRLMEAYCQRQSLQIDQVGVAAFSLGSTSHWARKSHQDHALRRDPPHPLLFPHLPPLLQIRFLFDGVRLRDTHTPEELDMENDDVIDAMLFQVENPSLHTSLLCRAECAKLIV